MAAVKPHSSVMLMLVAFSRHEEALAWARQTAEAAWGPVALESPAFPFDATSYYAASMGTELRKKFFAFENLIQPQQLVEIKLQTNAWEEAYQRHGDWAESRPLNLDPGYLTPAKFVLATTKDRDHRLYLDKGIYAEVTLHFHRGEWRTRPWTYPDYHNIAYHQFLTRAREHLRLKHRTGP